MTTDLRRPDLERSLHDRGVAWRFEEALPLAGIDAFASAVNQARLVAIDEPTVERYAADMERGDRFPAIVVVHLDVAARQVLVGGNHRLAAARRSGIATLPAYVLEDVDATTARLLGIEDNRHHGLPLTEEERIWHAVELIGTGLGQVAAAEVCGLAVVTLGRHLAAARADWRVASLDVPVPGWDRLSASTRSRMGAIEDDRVFERLARLVADGAVSSGEVSRLVAELRDAPQFEALRVLGVLEREAADRVRRGPGRPATSSPARRLMGELDALLRHRPELVDDDVAGDEQRALLRKQISLAAIRLMQLDRRLARGEQASA